MSILLLIKKFIEAIVGINKEPWKYIYPIFTICALLLVSVWNSYVERFDLNILRITIMIEGIFYCILLLIGLIKKDVNYTLDIEKSIFYLPLFIYNTAIANAFLVLTFLYYLFVNFRFNKAGKTTASIFILLNIFILSMFRLDLLSFKEQGLFLLALTLILSIIHKSKIFCYSTLVMIFFYGLQFLETTPKLILGSSSVIMVIILKILIREKIIDLKKLREISILEEIRIKIETFFKNDEKTLALISLNAVNSKSEKKVVEDKIYYLNTIKQAQALSLASAIIGLLLSLYFVGNIL